MAISIVTLSGSTDGKGIKVTGTATGSSVTVHTAQNQAALPDLLTLFCFNSDTQARLLTIEWGGTTDPDNTIEQSIPAGAGLVPVTYQLAIENNLVVKAFASTANVLIIYGQCYRTS